MSIVKKLSIQGVRSFSPLDNKGQWIEFDTPLTLILGINGSGKTTIIESLKFAITNQLPPNSKNGAFVNDPKLGNCVDSMAKVILEVEDLKGDKFLTTRKLKATVKNRKGDITMKQLEATIRFKSANGQTREISSKCADVKFEMCRVMGVSEAVLNNVIFCHQEESCWPLEEGSSVKKKFDAIFNTEAYIKASTKLLEEDKSLQTKIKVELEGLRYVKENRELALKKKRQLDDYRIKQQEQNDRTKEYEKEIKVLDAKLREIQQLEDAYVKKKSEVTEKRTTIEMVEKQIVELRNAIKNEFRGGISELEEHIEKFNEQFALKHEQTKKLDRDMKAKNAEWNKLDALRSNLLTEQGKFEQEENNNKKRLQELDVLMIDILSTLKKIKNDTTEGSLSVSFSGYLEACTGDSGNLSYDAVFKTLSSAIRMKETEREKIKEEFEKEESELQIAIDEIRGKMASTEKEKQMKSQQLNESKKNYQDITKRLQDLEGSNEMLAMLDDDEEKCAEQIEAIEKSGSLSKYDSEIKTLATEVKDLESKVSSVSDIISVLVRDKSKTDQIAMLTRQRQQKENDASEIMRRVEDDLTALLGEIPEDGLARAVTLKAKTLATEVKERKAALKKSEVSLGVSKSELKRVITELAQKEAKLRDDKEKVTDILEHRDYTDVYTDLNETLEKTQSDCYYAESASFLYKKYIGKLNKKDCCPLCKRDFKAKEQIKQLTKEIEGDITRMNQEVPRFKEEIEVLKAKQTQVLDVKPLWDACKTLENEVIPGLKTKRKELEDKVEKLQEEIEEISSTVAILDTDAGLANKSMGDVALYEQYKKEIKKWDDQIAKLENSRDSEAKRCTSTLSEAQTELRELRETVESKRSEKEKTEDKRNKKRDELANLQQKKNKLQQQKLRITAELQNRDALETQKKELEVSTKELQAKISELAQSLPSMKSDIAKAEKNKVACVKRKDGSLKNLSNEREALEQQKFRISEIHKRIDEFEKKKGRYADIQNKMDDCKEKLGLCENQKKEIASQMDSLKEDIANQELKKRELQDTLSLKQKEESVSKLKVELVEKERMLAQAEIHGVAAEKRELSTRHTRAFAKLNEYQGSKREIAKSIASLENELATPQFKHAELEYIQRVAKKTVYEKALKDIRRYNKALDVAIMQYHHKKMEKINKIMFEYWRRIYKGNDIDKIMIKTESEIKDPGAKAKATASTRKQYNYRVVMCRRGVDIDMRGRCSAGQRVLASIIIRIALAESFGSRCGIITLDEPTTNLDRKNVDSLADALADLAESMKSRKNFQLIVITHDSDFTSRLSAVDAVEKYWKVGRDKDGFSQITMVPKRGFGGYA